MLKEVLFDLDGTLLPMDQDVFTNGYFKLLCRKLAGHGYDSDQLVKAVWKGTGAMVKNQGARSNEEAFWHCFSGIYGEDALKDIHPPCSMRFMPMSSSSRKPCAAIIPGRGKPWNYRSRWVCV